MDDADSDSDVSMKDYYLEGSEENDEESGEESDYSDCSSESSSDSDCSSESSSDSQDPYFAWHADFLKGTCSESESEPDDSDIIMEDSENIMENSDMELETDSKDGDNSSCMGVLTDEQRLWCGWVTQFVLDWEAADQDLCRVKVAALLGGAGTGKTKAALFLAEKLRERERKYDVSWSATVGGTAFKSNGTTLHSLLGLGVADYPNTEEGLWDSIVTRGKEDFWQANSQHIVFVDEFQRLEASRWGPILSLAASKNVSFFFVLIGDVEQATENNAEGVTGFINEHISTKGWPVVKLDRRFRFDEEIHSVLERAKSNCASLEDIITLGKFGQDVDEISAIHLFETRKERSAYWAKLASDKQDEATLIRGTKDGWDAANMCGDLYRDLCIIPGEKYILKRNMHGCKVGNGTVIDELHPHFEGECVPAQAEVPVLYLVAKVGNSTFKIEREICSCGQKHYQFPVHLQRAMTFDSSVGLEFDDVVVHVQPSTRPRSACLAISRGRLHTRTRVIGVSLTSQVNYNMQHALQLTPRPPLNELLGSRAVSAVLQGVTSKAAKALLHDPEEDHDIGREDPAARRQVTAFLLEMFSAASSNLRSASGREPSTFAFALKQWKKHVGPGKLAQNNTRQVCLYHGDRDLAQSADDSKEYRLLDDSEFTRAVSAHTETRAISSKADRDSARESIAYYTALGSMSKRGRTHLHKLYISGEADRSKLAAEQIGQRWESILKSLKTTLVSIHAHLEKKRLRASTRKALGQAAWALRRCIETFTEKVPNTFVERFWLGDPRLLDCLGDFLGNNTNLADRSATLIIGDCSKIAEEGIFGTAFFGQLLRTGFDVNKIKRGTASHTVLSTNAMPRCPVSGLHLPKFLQKSLRAISQAGLAASLDAFFTTGLGKEVPSWQLFALGRKAEIALTNIVDGERIHFQDLCVNDGYQMVKGAQTLPHPSEVVYLLNGHLKSAKSEDVQHKLRVAAANVLWQIAIAVRNSIPEKYHHDKARMVQFAALRGAGFSSVSDYAEHRKKSPELDAARCAMATLVKALHKHSRVKASLVANSYFKGPCSRADARRAHERTAQLVCRELYPQVSSGERTPKPPKRSPLKIKLNKIHHEDPRAIVRKAILNANILATLANKVAHMTSWQGPVGKKLLSLLRKERREPHMSITALCEEHAKIKSFVETALCEEHAKIKSFVENTRDRGRLFLLTRARLVRNAGRIEATTYLAAAVSDQHISGMCSFHRVLEIERKEVDIRGAFEEKQMAEFLAENNTAMDSVKLFKYRGHPGHLRVHQVTDGLNRFLSGQQQRVDLANSDQRPRSSKELQHVLRLEDRINCNHQDSAKTLSYAILEAFLMTRCKVTRTYWRTRFDVKPMCFASIDSNGTVFVHLQGQAQEGRAVFRLSGATKSKRTWAQFVLWHGEPKDERYVAGQPFATPRAWTSQDLADAEERARGLKPGHLGVRPTLKLPTGSKLSKKALTPIVCVKSDVIIESEEEEQALSTGHIAREIVKSFLFIAARQLGDLANSIVASPKIRQRLPVWSDVDEWSVRACYVSEDYGRHDILTWDAFRSWQMAILSVLASAKLPNCTVSADFDAEAGKHGYDARLLMLFAAVLGGVSTSSKARQIFFGGSSARKKRFASMLSAVNCDSPRELPAGTTNKSWYAPPIISYDHKLKRVVCSGGMPKQSDLLGLLCALSKKVGRSVAAAASSNDGSTTAPSLVGKISVRTALPTSAIDTVAFAHHMGLQPRKLEELFPENALRARVEAVEQMTTMTVFATAEGAPAPVEIKVPLNTWKAAEKLALLATLACATPTQDTQRAFIDSAASPQLEENCDILEFHNQDADVEVDLAKAARAGKRALDLFVSNSPKLIRHKFVDDDKDDDEGKAEDDDEGKAEDDDEGKAEDDNEAEVEDEDEDEAKVEDDDEVDGKEPFLKLVKKARLAFASAFAHAVKCDFKNDGMTRAKAVGRHGEPCVPKPVAAQKNVLDSKDRLSLCQALMLDRLVNVPLWTQSLELHETKTRVTRNMVDRWIKARCLTVLALVQFAAPDIFTASSCASFLSTLSRETKKVGAEPVDSAPPATSIISLKTRATEMTLKPRNEPARIVKASNGRGSMLPVIEKGSMSAFRLTSVSFLAGPFGGPQKSVKTLLLQKRTHRIKPQGYEIQALQIHLRRSAKHDRWVLSVLFGAVLTERKLASVPRTVSRLEDLKTEANLQVAARSIGVLLQSGTPIPTIESHLHHRIAPYVMLGLHGLGQADDLDCNAYISRFLGHFAADERTAIKDRLESNESWRPYLDISNDDQMFQPRLPETQAEIMWYRRTICQPVVSPLGEPGIRYVAVDRGGKCAYTVSVNTGYVQNGCCLARKVRGLLYRAVARSRPIVHANHHRLLMAADFVNDPRLDWQSLPKGAGRQMVKAIAFGAADRSFRYRLALAQQAGDHCPLIIEVKEPFGTGTCPCCGSWIPQVGARSTFACGKCQKDFDRDPTGALNARKNLLLALLATFGGPVTPDPPKVVETSRSTTPKKKRAPERKDTSKSSSLSAKRARIGTEKSTPVPPAASAAPPAASAAPPAASAAPPAASAAPPTAPAASAAPKRKELPRSSSHGQKKKQAPKRKESRSSSKSAKRARLGTELSTPVPDTRKQAGGRSPAPTPGTRKQAAGSPNRPFESGGSRAYLSSYAGRPPGL